MKKKLFDILHKNFKHEDKLEPFQDREYVRESNRIYNLLKDEIGDFSNPTDRAIYDVVREVISVHERLINEIKKSLDSYQKAYMILMDYWDSLPDEEKPKIHKRLKGLGL